MKAKTLSQVIAAEAGGKTRNQRLTDMKNIYSSMVNRAKATGVAVKDVFSVKSQYNAYNSAMPPGTAALTSLADEAVALVDAYGVTHPGMYYATPAAVSNLPAGLVEIPGIGGVHKAFYDPKNRAVVTKVGAKPVNTARLAQSLPATMEVPGGVRPADVAALPSAERFGYEASPERFGRVGLAEQVARAVSETSPLGEMTMAGDVPSQAPGAVRDSVARDMIDTAQWSPAGFAKPALANAAISRALSPPSAPSVPGSWQGIGATLGGFRAPSELSNSFGLANIGNLASVQQATRPGFSPPSNFSGGTPAISPIGSAPVGAVTRGPLGPALARPSAPPSNFAKGTMPAPSRPGIFDNDFSKGPSLTSFADQNRQAGQFAADMGRYAPAAKTDNQRIQDAQQLTGAVTRMSMAPETAGVPNRATAMTTQQERDYAQDRRESPTTWAGAAPALRPSPPAARPTTNVASAPAPRATAPSVPAAPARPAVGHISAYAPSATPSSSLGDFAANGLYTGAVTNASALAPQPAAPSVAGIAPGTGQYTQAMIEAGLLAPAVPAPVQTVLNPAFTQQTINEAVQERTPAYTAPAATAYDVYSGVADTAMDNTGQNRVSSIPGGTTVSNRYGATTGMMNGYQTAVGSMPSVPGMSMPSKSTVGGAVKGGLVGAGVAGPIGGVIGALAGAMAAKAMAEKNGTAAAASGQSGGGLLGGLFGGGTSGASSSKSSGSSKSGSSTSRSGGGGYQTSAGAQSNSKSMRY